MNFKQFLIEEKLGSKEITGLPHLSDYIEKGKDLVLSLLSDNIIISEKKDGQKFSLIKTKEGNVEYWSKNYKLDKPFLIINPAWKKLINRLEALRKKTNNFSDIPNDSEISGEFIKDVKANTIEYTKIPKGSWVVYYADIAGTKYGVEEYSELHKWADYLESEREPIIFDGKLSKTQQKKILEFLEMPKEDKIEKFKTTDFTQFILEIINPKYEPLLGKKMEGIVIYTMNKEIPLGVVKIVDPLFTITNRERWDKNKDTIEGFKSDLIKFLSENMTVEKIKYLKDVYSKELADLTDDERFIELVDKVFILFADKNKKELESIFSKYKSLKDLELVSLDEKLISPKVLGKIKDNWFLRELYILMLIVLRKEKSKKSGIFKNIDISQFNKIVREIK